MLKLGMLPIWKTDQRETINYRYGGEETENLYCLMAWHSVIIRLSEVVLLVESFVQECLSTME